MKKFLTMFTVFIMLFSIVSKSAVSAVVVEPVLKIDGIKITDDNNVEYLAGDRINQYDNLVVKMDFTIEDETVFEGSVVEIALSSDLRFVDTVTFNVYDPSKVHLIAVATVDGTAKKITLTFTDYPEGKSDVKGFLQFFSRVDMSTVTTNKNVDVHYILGGSVIFNRSLDYKKSVDSLDEIMSKYQWFEQNVKDKYVSIIRVNPSAKVYTDVTIKDELRTLGTQYDTESFIIQKGIWSINNEGVWAMQNSTVVTSNYSIVFSENDTKFSIHFGEMSETDQYRISYKVKTNREPVSGELFSNYVEMIDVENRVESRTVNTAFAGGGGQAEGTTFSVKVVKIDEFGIPLPNAQFKLSRDNSTVEYLGTTNSSGEYIFSNLLRTDYTLVETVAPGGYALNPASFPVPAEDLVAGTNYVITVANSAIVSVEGEKTWDDANNQDRLRPGAIVVNLLAGGNKIDSVTVTQGTDGKWTYSFPDLPVYKDGAAIKYSVTEEAVPGYTPTYDGFNIINTHRPETINLEGEKTWDDANNQDGIRPKSIIVNLLADGDEIDSVTVTQGTDGKWTYSFPDLPVYKDGAAIKYSVTEEAVPGYTPTYDGFNIINTHILATTNVEGEKIWIDANNLDKLRPSFIIVNLIANGEKIDEMEVRVDQSGKWLFNFENLPTYKNGAVIEYSVTEEAVPGYTTTYNGFNITNTVVPKGDVDNLPDTGVAQNYTGNLVVIAGISILLYSYSKKTRRA